MGYAPVNLERDGKFRRIEVKVGRPRTEVRARRGYVVPRDADLPQRAGGEKPAPAPAGDGAPRAQGAEVPAVLTALANETGGDVWRAEDDAALGHAFAAALAEVRSRYVLRFEPAGGRPGEWRDVRVRVRNGRGDVRARKGYRLPSGATRTSGASGGPG